MKCDSVKKKTSYRLFNMTEYRFSAFYFAAPCISALSYRHNVAVFFIIMTISYYDI